ncbi:MAG: hypothetical protein J5J06_03225 [Phycisphaerae bacterium]|nr:hypothetical protein [Phycisphaerae bacterium]
MRNRCRAVLFLMVTLVGVIYCGSANAQVELSVPAEPPSTPGSEKPRGPDSPLATTRPGDPVAFIPTASLCMESETQCHVPDGLVRTALRLRRSDVPIVAGQFSLRFDPDVLDIVDVAPGRACDPDSPFVSTFAENVNKELGAIFLAVSVDAANLDDATAGPASMVCLTFRAKTQGLCDVGLVAGLSPTTTLLSDAEGDSVLIRNDQVCSAGPASLYLSRSRVEVGRRCDCFGGTADCSSLDSACAAGVCDPVRGLCRTEPVNENRPCDDGVACTVLDTCVQGTCLGFRMECPSLCLSADQPCPTSGQHMTLRVMLGRSLSRIAAAQFSVQYDPASVELLSVKPGARCDAESPFVIEAFKRKSDAVGEVDYGVLVDPFDLSRATRGPSTIACLTFLARTDSPGDMCLFDNGGTEALRLADDKGNPVPINNVGACEASGAYPLLSCIGACQDIPATSTWGLLALTLVVLTAGKLLFNTGYRKSGDAL